MTAAPANGGESRVAGALAGLVLAAIEDALAAVLEAHPDLRERVGMLAGRRIAVEFIELGTGFLLLPDTASVQVRMPDGRPADVTLRATLPVFLRAMATRAHGLPPGMEFQGDAQLGQTIQQILRAADLDWEELLARRVGNVAAHQIGKFARTTVAWARRAADVLLQDAAEYLREEARLVPERTEVDAFLDGVDALRMDVDRLAARLARLERALAEDEP